MLQPSEMTFYGSMFNLTDPLVNIMLPQPFRKSELDLKIPETFSGKFGTGRLFIFDGHPMLIRGFVLTTYRKWLAAANEFIAQFHEMVTEAAEPDEKDIKKGDKKISGDTDKKSPIVLNPTLKDMVIEDLSPEHTEFLRSKGLRHVETKPAGSKIRHIYRSEELHPDETDKLLTQVDAHLKGAGYKQHNSHGSLMQRFRFYGNGKSVVHVSPAKDHSHVQFEHSY